MALRKRNGEVFLVHNITPIICCFPWIAAGMWRQSPVCVFEWRSVTSFGVFTKTHFFVLGTTTEEPAVNTKKNGALIHRSIFIFALQSSLPSVSSSVLNWSVHPRGRVGSLRGSLSRFNIHWIYIKCHRSPWKPNFEPWDLRNCRKKCHSKEIYGSRIALRLPKAKMGQQKREKRSGELKRTK